MYQYNDYLYLYDRLAAYAESDYYPFHMPGHKRADLYFENPYKIDITEIEGFDNLHHANEILLDSQERLRRLYKSKRAYYLINGSTCGLLSAIGALSRPHDEVIIARNCHKSVYNAVKLFELKAFYVYPEFLPCAVQGMVTPKEIEKAFLEHPNAKLAVITSPTYEGIVSDIKRIADVVKKYNAFLIIDEAHGAHFSLNEHFPESAVWQGADIVIQSLHKTLPSFTQTAALHIASDRADCWKVEEMLGIFQTSSPSYILMAGIERCVRLLEQSGRQLFENYYKRLEHFYQECEQLKYLHVFNRKEYGRYDVYDADPSKILISTHYTSIDGPMLYEQLLHKYHLQMEMCSADYVLAMTSLMDTQEGFDRLLSALLEIDRDLDYCYTGKIQYFLQKAYEARVKALEISEAGDPVEETELKDCIGRICAEFLYMYPPGIPMIVPGEIITEELIEVLHECRRMNIDVQGARDIHYRKILTVAHT